MVSLSSTADCTLDLTPNPGVASLLPRCETRAPGPSLRKALQLQIRSLSVPVQSFLLSRYSPMLPQLLFLFPLSLRRRGSLPSLPTQPVFSLPRSYTYGPPACPGESLGTSLSLCSPDSWNSKSFGLNTSVFEGRGNFGYPYFSTIGPRVPPLPFVYSV